ncbi:MAG: hypothetical protein HY756_01405 [Nitrospirae bacterium]|nr:hypothetical protein [Nitrospirota bacterium]
MKRKQNISSELTTLSIGDNRIEKKVLHIAKESETLANLIKKTSEELTVLAENLQRLVTWFKLESSRKA